MYRSPFVSSLLTAAVLLTGCGAEDTTETSPAASERPAASVEPAEPSTSGPAETAADAPGAEATDAEATDAEATDAEGTSRDGSGSGSSSSGTEGLPGWPIESTPVHGDKFWAAYVAVGAPGDPSLQQVLTEVQQLWPRASLGELGCDDGAAAALGRTPTEHAVAVYFATEQHTTEFRRRWEAPFVGVVHVTTFCAD
jgi:hypothetical protein